MANMIPLIKSGGFFASRYWTPLVIGNGLTTTGGDTPDPPVQKTVSGSIVTITDALAAPAIALSTAINPAQDLHGFTYPWPAGGGKNKYPILVGNDVWVNNGSATHSTGADGSLIINTSSSSSSSGVYLNTASATMTSVLTAFGDDARTISMDVVASASGTVRLTSGNTQTWTIGTTKQRISIVSTAIGCSIYGVSNGATLTVSNVQIEAGSTATSFAPYENICPISGFTEANIVVSPTTTAGDGTTYTVSFGAAGTVYGGTLDVTNGTLTVDRFYHQILASDLETSTKDSGTNVWRLKTTGRIVPNLTDNTYQIGICNKYTFRSNYDSVRDNNNSIAFSLPSGTNVLIRDDTLTTFEEVTAALTATPIQVVYPLKTPQTYTLTPTEVQLLLGTNNVWSDTNGDVTLTYLADGRVNSLTALNMLLGGMYTPSDDVSDREALNIIMGDTT